MSIYKWLYTHLTPWWKRPWTFVWRDLWHQAEYLMQALWFFGGIAVGIYFGWQIAGIAWAIYTLGYINGHFFWGTKWVKGQEG